MSVLVRPVSLPRALGAGEIVDRARILHRSAQAGPIERARRYAIVLLLALVVALDVSAWSGVLRGVVIFPTPGMDLDLYIDAARRFLAGESFYPPQQLAGPYAVDGHPVGAQPILYPPTALVLLIPFTVLPAILWWLIPIAVTVVVVWRQRPSWLAWAAIGALIAWPGTLYALIAGNPGIWLMALVAVSTRYPAFAPWILLKLTLAPFALIGVRKREWWGGLAVLGVVSALFLPMWTDYLAALSNARSALGPLYSLPQFALMVIPLVALAPRRVPQRGPMWPQRPRYPAAGTSRSRTERAPSR